MSTYRKYIGNILFKRILLVGLTFVVLISVIFIIIFKNSSGEPVLKFDKLAIDLGEISDESSSEITFKFQNVGHGELLIEQLGGSCPCQRLRVTKTHLLPDENGQVLAKLIPSNKSGPITDTIRVHSNDPINPITILEIKRFIKKKIQVIPDTILLDLSSGFEARQVTILGPTNDEKFELISASASEFPTDINIRYLGFTNDYRRKWQLEIKLDDTKVPSIIDSSILMDIETSSQITPHITIPIRVVRRSAITARPSSLTWFINEKKEYVENKTVSLFYEYDKMSRNNKDERIDALCLTFKRPEYLDVKLLEREITEDYAKWKLEISLSVDKVNSPTRGQMRFDVKSRNSHLDIPIAVIILSKNVEAE